MTSRTAIVLAFPIAAALAPAPARAQRAEKIVLESHTGDRSSQAAALMAPILEELTRRSYAAGARLGSSYMSVRSRPATTGGAVNPDELKALVDAGFGRWVSGAFPEAIETLERAMDIVRKEPASIAKDQARRRLVEKALMGLALSYLRRGEAGQAETYMAEVVRSFADQPSRVTYGPEALRLYDSVRAKLDQRGRGRLEIYVSDPAAVVFLNEQYVAVGSITRNDLYPGPYRVYVQGKAQGRVYPVEVVPGKTTKVGVDMAYDAALVTGEWTGLKFPDEGARKDEDKYVVRFAREIEAREVIVIGIAASGNAPVVVGKAVSVATGKPLRTANVAMDPLPSDKRLRALARYLAGESVDDPGIKVLSATPPGDDDDDDDDDVAHDRGPHRGAARIWKWLVAAGAVGALGTGAVLLWIDGDCVDQPVCTQFRDTKLPGFAAVGAGVALGGVATWLFIKDNRERRRAGVAVAPGRGGVSVWAHWDF